MPPLITTIITTYKRPQLLKRAVNSVLKQTYPHFKVCVYDNASGDETEAIMQEFVKNDPRVEYHRHPENIGMMANYAFGFSRINTQYFSFLSDDDYLLPWFYETALEGFSKHPDAAFSACGVLAIDMNNQVVADPISGWKREGYFSVPEGIYEMISCKYNFPPPQGVLFQHPIIKEISPDWSKDIQVMWDPDYLIQISSRFPFIMTKKIASIFLAHEAAFSTGFYKRMLKSAKYLDEYLLTTNKLIERVMNNSAIAKEIKINVKKAYLKMLKNEIATYMRFFIESGYYKESYYSGKLVLKNYGVNFPIIKLLLETLARHKFPRISSKTRKALAILRKLKLREANTENHFFKKWRRFEYKDYADSISQ